jgi:hypothetical protein
VKYLPERWPGQHFKKVGAKFREHNFEQADRPVEFVKRQMVMIRCLVPQVRSPADGFCLSQAKGEEVPSFTSKMLREGLNEYEEDVVKWGANSLYGGGTDTVRQRPFD